MTKVYGLISTHSELLSSGRMVAPGQMISENELKTEDKWLLNEGRLLLVSADPQELAGDDLQVRARDLDVEGRSGMSADELRKAVASAEKGIKKSGGK